MNHLVTENSLALSRLHEAVNRHDPEGIAAVCAPEVIWEDPAAGGLIRGRRAVTSFHRDTMFIALPDVRVMLLDGPFMSSDGRQLAVRLRIAGTMVGPLNPPGFAPTNSRLEFETAEFSSFEQGLLVHHRVVLDMLGLARQIGAVPRENTLGERIGMLSQHLAAWRTRSRHRR